MYEDFEDDEEEEEEEDDDEEEEEWGDDIDLLNSKNDCFDSFIRND